MRRLAILAVSILLLAAAPAASARETAAIDAATAAAACEAFFGVGPGRIRCRRASGTCAVIDACRAREGHRRRRAGRRDR